MLIFANARWDDDEPALPKYLTSRLFVSKMSCGEWHGEGTLDVQTDVGGLTEAIAVNLEELRFSRATGMIIEAMSGRTQSNFLGTIVPNENTRYQMERPKVPSTVNDATYSFDLEAMRILSF